MHSKFIFSCLSLFFAYTLTAQIPALDWAKGLGGTSGDAGNCVAVDNNGNVFTTGYFQGTADFDPGAGALSFTSAGGKDIFINKLDANGDLVWSKQIGGTGEDEGNGIAVDALGNVYVTGAFEGAVDFDPNAGTSTLSAAGQADIFVLKLDGAGNLVWAKCLGGTSADESRAIDVASDFSVYTTGQFTGTADFDPGAGVSNLISAGGSDIFVNKLDASGNFVWAKQMGGTSTDFGFSLALTAADEVYTTGYFSGTADFDPGASVASIISSGSDDIFISKLDASGNYLWGKNVGGSAADRGYSIATNSGGNAYLTGFFNGTADLDPGAAVANFISAGTGDVFILNLDANGNFVWAKQMSGTTDNVGHGIAVDSVGNTYLVGVFQGSCDFDPGAGVLSFTAAGPNDIFIAKLNATGDLVWAGQAGGSGPDLGEVIALDAGGAVYATGVFLGSADLDPGSGTATLTSAGGGDVFVQKLEAPPAGMLQHEMKISNVYVYPNPASDRFSIITSSDAGIASVEIFNAAGEKVLAKAIVIDNAIDISFLNAGIYFVNVEFENGSTQIEKLVKAN
jgi:hypothetical protein